MFSKGLGDRDSNSYLHKTKNNYSRVSREGSLNSDQDDLTIIAEFDCASDEEDAPSYHLTSSYEIIGFSLKNDVQTEATDSQDAMHISKSPPSNEELYKSFYKGYFPEVDGFEDIVKSNMRNTSNQKLKKRRLKSSGSQTTTAFNSRATSPLNEIELFSKIKSSQNEKETSVFKVLPNEIEFIRLILDESQAKPNAEETTRVNFLDIGVATERVPVSNAGTSMHEDYQLKAAGSQTFTLNNHIGTQVDIETNEMSADAEKLLDEVKYWEEKVDELEQDNSIKTEKLALLEDQETLLKEENGKLKKMLEDQIMHEKEISKLNKSLQDVDVELKISQSELKNAVNNVDKKKKEIDELTKKLSEYNTKEYQLEKMIENLKSQLKSSNKQLEDVTEKIKTETAEGKPELPKLNDEARLLENIAELMQINSELKNAAQHGRDSQELLKKYNDLRKIASRVQTAISPLKAKLSLANKKCRIKDELLKKVLQNGLNAEEIPLHIKEEIEENLKDSDHYRALSPLTITHLERLEHGLVHHLNDHLSHLGPGNEMLPSERSISSGNLNGSKMEDVGLDESLYAILYQDDVRRNQQLSLNKQPNNSGNFFLEESSSTNLPQNTRKNRISNLEKSTIDYWSFNSLKDGYPRSGLVSESFRGNEIPILTNDVSPPSNFRIDDIIDRKKFLFCWEPPSNDVLLRSSIGYELFINGTKCDFIPGVLSTTYTLSSVRMPTFPVVFELYTVQSSGKSSVPSRIVIHGLQKINTNLHGFKSLKLKSLSKNNINNPIAETSNKTRNTYLAFYDFDSSGFTVSKNGVSYSEISFKTGDVIETIGEILPSGHVFGKLKGSTHLGLVPANFLEKLTE